MRLLYKMLGKLWMNAIVSTGTQWLDAAMDKLGDIDGWSLNNKPINKDIKDFIFDSSKAKPIELLESNDIEEMPEYQNFDKFCSRQFFQFLIKKLLQ